MKVLTFNPPQAPTYDESLRSLGDKLQRLGFYRPYFLYALNIIVDKELAKYEDDDDEGDV